MISHSHRNSKMLCVRSLIFVLLVEFIRSSGATFFGKKDLTTKIPTTDDLIAKAGFDAELHHVETDDGFTIECFRILSRRNRGTSRKPRPVVVLQHTVLGSSSDWVFADRKRSLGFVLVDAGYDVWLTNFRGNIYGRNTTNPSVSWDFTIDELGFYDLPAQIDYILGETALKNLHFVGHGLGNTAFYIMLSLRPEYNRKIRNAISLAPVAFVDQVKGYTLRFFKYISGMIATSIGLFNTKIILPEPLHYGSRNLYDIPIFGNIYYYSLGLLFGQNSDQYDPDMVSGYARVSPVGTTWKVLQHFLQWIDSGHFRRYDYGQSENMRIYGQPTPPDYNLRNVKVAITLLQGKNDHLAVNQDVDKLEDSFGTTLVSRSYIEDPQFSHLDFIWAKDVSLLVYRKVLSALDLYHPKNKKFHMKDPNPYA